MYGFDHHSGAYLEVSGAKIYYEITGNLSAPALLFLHGGFGHIGYFNEIVSELAHAYKIIGIDNRGHGRSTLGTQALTYELLQTDVEAVLKHLDIDTVAIVGFSNGGTLGYRLAALTNLRITQLVTIGAPWRSMLDEPSRNAFSQLTPDICEALYPAEFAAYHRLNPEPDLKRVFNSLIKMALGTDASSHPNERVKKICCPLLIIRGAHDQVVGHEDVVALADKVSGSRILTIPDAGHEAFLVQPNVLARDIKDFLESEGNKVSADSESAMA